jgi:hypothetical protein
VSFRFNPLSILSAGVDAARTVADAFVEGWTNAAPDDRPARAAEPAPAATPAQSAVRPAAPDTGLETKMQKLLTRALEQSTASGQDELFHRILDQIVPDEARMIGALSDGTVSPMVSVHALTRAGLLGEALIENASLVGRTANVALPRLTPTYVGHLMALGLIDAGPEDDSLKDEYQILLAETDVLSAIRQGSRGPVPARVEKRTIRLSPLGHALWAASMGPQE